jgi:hypothetical protein
MQVIRGGSVETVAFASGRAAERIPVMSVHHESTGIDRDARVRAIAYSIWEEEGCPEGRSEEHWLRACELVDLAEGQAEAILDPDWLKRNGEPKAATPDALEQKASAATPPPLSEAIKRLKSAQAA